MRESARRDGGGPALEGPSAATGAAVRWTWSALDDIADVAALRLIEAGVRPGDVVAARLPPSPEMVALLHAAPRAGALLAPVHTRWTLPELGRGLAAVGRPRLLLAAGEEVDELRATLPRTGTVAAEEVVPVEGTDESALQQREPDDPTLHSAIPELDADTPVVVLLTSGSTGTPRPVPLTHGNLLASARGAADRLRLDSHDRWLASLSPAHVGGLALLHRAAVVGSPVVTRPEFDPAAVLRLAAQGEFSHASLVPSMLAHLLDLNGDAPAPGGLRCLLLGGAYAPRPLLRRALAGRWPVALTYGLTEATSQVATAPPDAVRAKPGSVGRPLADVAVAIRARGDAADGEVLVRGPTVAPLPPTREAAAGTVHVGATGWLHTGDVGRFDADGDLWITGRISERIVTGGVTVEPAEVEGVLMEHPKVREVAVVGAPDPEWGERIVAVVAPADPRHPPSLAELLEYARPRLSAAKRPREIRAVEALPRTATGKVDRSALHAP